jgi:hypothetical protein
MRGFLNLYAKITLKVCVGFEIKDKPHPNPLRRRGGLEDLSELALKKAKSYFIKILLSTFVLKQKWAKILPTLCRNIKMPKDWLAWLKKN